MRHAFLGGAISALLTLAPLSAAGAADLPVKARPMAPAPAVTPDWSGIYVGVVGGYAWGEGHFAGTGAGAGQNNNVSMDGGMIGGRVGYDHGFGNGFVIGAVADLSWADLDGQTCVARFACNPAEDAFAIGKMKWFATVRARAGVTAGKALFYATGGLALAGLEGSLTHLTSPADPTLTASHTHTGWVAGAGIDYRVMGNVIFGIEYLYADLGSEHYDFSNTIPGVPVVIGADGNLTASIVRGSISYRFGGPG